MIWGKRKEPSDTAPTRLPVYPALEDSDLGDGDDYNPAFPLPPYMPNPPDTIGIQPPTATLIWGREAQRK